MAINTVSTRYHGLIFDGENSRDYGVYITEPAVFNAPERDVEFFSIPGRSGDYELDRGRWHNITVTYSCAFFTDTVSDFNAGLSEFRNMLASKTGYCRLEDEINTGEYRMGSFVSGMEVDTFNPKTGTFDVVFTCKPQRWLTSGETPVAVASGDTITNPTLYDATPVFQLTGYGALSVGGSEITVDNVPLGLIKLNSLVPKSTGQGSATPNVPTTDLTNVGDSWYCNGVTQIIEFKKTNKSDKLISVTIDEATSDKFPNAVATVEITGDYTFRVIINTGYFESAISANASFASLEWTIRVTSGTGAVSTAVGSFYIQWTYVPDKGVYIATGIQDVGTGVATYSFTGDEIMVYSTDSALGHPMYIDCELGVAFNTDNGPAVSTNGAVALPEILPKLIPGETAITFDNTFSRVAIVPRWWTL